MSDIDYRIDARGVATLLLNNPEKHNAFDHKMIANIHAALEAANTDASVRVLVLAAAGKSFSAGADLGWMRSVATYTYAENMADAKGLADMLYQLNTLSKPTIARIQGSAFGGALGLVSCCDMAVAAHTVRFCLSEVKLGLIPAAISPYVIAAIGARAARRYFVTAERFSAARAHQLGLVSELADHNELDVVVEQWISELLTNGPIAMSEAKRLVQDVANSPIDDTLIHDTCERIAKLRVSPEGQEGLTAFLEKRSASYHRSAT